MPPDAPERSHLAAVQDLNERGGALGASRAVVPADFSNPDPAGAGAHKLLAEGVPVVLGHLCSGAIPASPIYEKARMILVSPAATKPAQVADALRREEFDTVLGAIGFDKGDVTELEPFVWYIWQEGGYAPVDPPEPTE